VAIVQAAPVVGGQRVGSYLEIWRGVLDREAELAPDGLSLTLRIASMTAAMKQKLSGGATSGRLVRGWHHFVPRPDSADGCQVSCEQIWEAGAAISTAYTLHDANTIETDGPAYTAHVDLFDITLPDGERAGQRVGTALFPFTMGGQRLGVRLQPPTRGQHTLELLAALGYDEARVADFVARRVVA
jgi:hypothetical protein